MLRLFALVAAFTAVVAQRPEVCESPDQWTAKMLMYDPVEGHELTVQAMYYYDKIGLRKSRFEEVAAGNSSWRYLHVIELFSEHKRYEIDLASYDCRVSPLIRSGPLDGFHAHDIPVGAEFRGLFYIGSDAVSEGHVEASAWDYMFADRGYFWRGTFTTHGCIPIRIDTFNRTTFGVRFEEFFNVMPGIPDPSVFVPPEDCLPGKF